MSTSALLAQRIAAYASSSPGENEIREPQHRLLFQYARALFSDGDYAGALRAVRESEMALGGSSAHSLPRTTAIWEAGSIVEPVPPLHPLIALFDERVNVHVPAGACTHDLEAVQRALLACASADQLTLLTDATDFANVGVRHAKALSAHASSSIDAGTVAVARAFEASALHAFGVTCGKRAYLVNTYTQRQQLQTAALAALERAVDLADDSQRAAFTLSLAALNADVHKISVATRLCQRALELDGTLCDGWHLFALLLSCGRQVVEGVQACVGGLAESPAHIGLLLTQAKLLSEQGLHDEARLAIQGAADAAHFKADGGLVFCAGRVTVSAQVAAVAGITASSVSAADATRVRVLLTAAEVFAAASVAADAAALSATSSAASLSASSPGSSFAAMCAQATTANVALHRHTSASLEVAAPAPPANAPLRVSGTHWLADAIACAQHARTLLPLDAALAADTHTALGALVEMRAARVASGAEVYSTIATDATALEGASSSATAFAARLRDDAFAHYDAALAVNTAHVNAHVRLGRALLRRFEERTTTTERRASFESALAHLAAARRANAATAEAWLWYAHALRLGGDGNGTGGGDDAAASEALITALELERATPLMCFSEVARCV